ncbi:MAG: hypothetical protein HOP28_16075 [Gemmatimonadales bacterium]|nr:hypothetical protein [Gemmatimonadales bacterium]
MTKSHEDHAAVRATLARLNGRAWGIAIGLLFGGGLFLATIVLVARGGENVGQHLALLRAYFPGFTVTVVGSFVGFVYGFVVGYAIGRIIGIVYNRLVRIK